MKEYKADFLSIFAISFTVLSVIAFLIVVNSNPRVGRSPYVTVKRQINYMHEHIDESDKQKQNRHFYNEYLSTQLSVEGRKEGQFLFYTGDIPEISSDYVMVLYRGEKPFISTIVSMEDSDIPMFYNSRHDGEELLWEVEK